MEEEIIQIKTMGNKVHPVAVLIVKKWEVEREKDCSYNVLIQKEYDSRQRLLNTIEIERHEIREEKAR